MIPVTSYRDRVVGVFGLARSGLVAARALAEGGAHVLAWDDNAKGRERAAATGVTVCDWKDMRWQEASALVLAPGVPLTHPKPHDIVDWADSRNIPVIGDIELLIDANKSGAGVIGITGTNGKSTTTALTGHILRSAGKPAEVGGNIGLAALDLNPLGTGGVYVLELSSYQIELTPGWRANTALLLNVTPDHLDRHGTMDRYVSIKRRIFGGQGRNATAIVGIDDEYGAETVRILDAENTGRRIVPVSTGRVLSSGMGFSGSMLHEDGTPVLDAATLVNLPGKHNWQNIACAWAIARAEGLSSAEIIAGLKSFPGLAHRMERIAEINGVSFINDSKATNAEAAAKALACYEGIHWIAGGKAKEGGIASLSPFFGRIARAYLIGEAASEFSRQLGGGVPFAMCGDLATAVRQAFAAAKRGQVVLLSPACASFDQFADFEQRGETFRSIVQSIANEAQSASHHRASGAAA